LKTVLNTYTLTLVLILIPFFSASAQVDTTRTDSVRIDGAIETPPADTLASADSAGQLYKIIPWAYNHSLGSEMVSTDSTLRWQLVPSWTDKKNRDPGVITYRLGSMGRSNAMQINAHEARYQELYWEDIRMNDPVSGTVNWDLIPFNKINKLYSEDKGLSHRSTFYLKQYYINKPLTNLGFTESKFNFRELRFVLSQNFGQKTNAELSYRDLREDGEFDNSDIQGRQVYARVNHQMNNEQLIKFHLMNNNFDNGEPFGYVIPDLETFNFDRFAAVPRQSSAQSEMSATTAAINYYKRKKDTVKVEDNLHAGLFFNSRSREVAQPEDSTFYSVQSVGANVHKWLNLGGAELEGRLSYEQFSNQDLSRSNVLRDSWGILEGEADAAFEPLEFLTLKMGADFKNRTDGFNDFALDLEATLGIGKYSKLSAGVSGGTKMPTIQQLYWSSNQFRGNQNLDNENIQEAHAEFSISPSEQLVVGLRGQLKNIDKAVMVGEDSAFTNISRYNSVSVTPYFDYNSSLFEFSGSIAFHQFRDDVGSFSEPLPLNGNKRMWLKGSAYIKGFLFNRATFIKAGLEGMLSPFRYRAESYNTVLDFWQPLSNDQLLPTFNRLDVDISARVRSIMIVTRFENILDNVAQSGFFETANYPMPQRRFIFGIRVLFRN